MILHNLTGRWSFEFTSVDGGIDGVEGEIPAIIEHLPIIYPFYKLEMEQFQDGSVLKTRVRNLAPTVARRFTIWPVNGSDLTGWDDSNPTVLKNGNKTHFCLI